MRLTLTLWHLRLTTFGMATQQCILYVFLRYMSHCQYKNEERCTKILLFLLCMAGKNETYLGVQMRMSDIFVGF
jgi:hypothetical protein